MDAAITDYGGRTPGDPAVTIRGGEGRSRAATTATLRLSLRLMSAAPSGGCAPPLADKGLHHSCCIDHLAHPASARVQRRPPHRPAPPRHRTRAHGSFVCTTTAVLAPGAVASASTKATATPNLSGVTLTFADQFKGYETILTVANALQGRSTRSTGRSSSAGHRSWRWRPAARSTSATWPRRRPSSPRPRGTRSRNSSRPPRCQPQGLAVRPGGAGLFRHQDAVAAEGPDHRRPGGHGVAARAHSDTQEGRGHLTGRHD